MVTVAPYSVNGQAVILSAENLSKSYGDHLALQNFSFSLQAGRILGFLGPNGAGKTTAIRILITILEPSSGHFTVAGTHSADPTTIRHKIGVLPESLGFPKRLTGVEYLTYFGRHYGLSASAAQQQAFTLLAEVGLKERANSLIGSYSRGMRQRLGIARALVNDPVVVFLDEPTLGLDPRGKQELLALVRRIARERQAGVVLCSHLLSEIESVCDDVIILRAGKIVATGTVTDLLTQAPQNVIRVRVPASLVLVAQPLLANIDGVTDVVPSTTAEWLNVEVMDSAESQTVKNDLLRILLDHDIPVLAFEGDGNRLQDVFLQLTEA